MQGIRCGFVPVESGRWKILYDAPRRPELLLGEQRCRKPEMSNERAEPTVVENPLSNLRKPELGTIDAGMNDRITTRREHSLESVRDLYPALAEEPRHVLH